MANHKVLVIGPLNEGALAQSYARAFERLGMEVVRFDSERAMIQGSRFSGNRICAACCGRQCGMPLIVKMYKLPKVFVPR